MKTGNAYDQETAAQLAASYAPDGAQGLPQGNALMGINGGTPLAPSITTAGAHSTDTTMRPTEAEGRYRLGARTASENEAEAAQREADLQARGTELENQVSGAAIQQQKQLLAQRQLRAEQIEKQIQAESEQRQAYIREATKKPEDFWADKTTGQKIGAYVGMFLGAIGGAIAGTDNKALGTLNGLIERHVAQQQIQAQKYMKLAENSQGYLSLLYQRKAAALADADAQRVAAWTVATNEAQWQAKTQLPGQLRAQGEQKALQIAQKRDDADAKAEEGLRSKHEAYSAQTTTVEPSPDVLAAKGNGLRTQPPAGDLEKTEMMKQMGENAQLLLDLAKDPANVPTGKMVREYEQNENSLINRGIKEEEGGRPAIWASNAMRAVGMLPENAYPEGATEGQKKYLDTRAVLSHFRVNQLGGQTGLANPSARRTVMGPAAGGAGESLQDQIRKDAELAKGFIRQGEAAEKFSKEAMMEKRQEEAKAAGRSPATGAKVQQPTKRPEISFPPGGPRNAQEYAAQAAKGWHYGTMNGKKVYVNEQTGEVIPANPR